MVRGLFVMNCAAANKVWRRDTVFITSKLDLATTLVKIKNGNIISTQYKAQVFSKGFGKILLQPAGVPGRIVVDLLVVHFCTGPPAGGGVRCTLSGTDLPDSQTPEKSQPAGQETGPDGAQTGRRGGRISIGHHRDSCQRHFQF